MRSGRVRDAVAVLVGSSDVGCVHYVNGTEYFCWVWVAGICVQGGDVN